MAGWRRRDGRGAGRGVARAVQLLDQVRGAPGCAAAHSGTPNLQEPRSMALLIHCHKMVLSRLIICTMLHGFLARGGGWVGGWGGGGVQQHSLGHFAHNPAAASHVTSERTTSCGSCSACGEAGR